MTMILKCAPALQVLIPLFGALISVLSFHRFTAWIIAIVSTTLCLSLSLYCIQHINGTLTYNFGGWKTPIGIEYKIDYFNQPIVILLNLIFLFYLVFGQELITKTVTTYINNKTQHLFYSLLLFAHFGYLGMICTHDLFNFYVFIEISSLSSYVLMSKGDNVKSLIGALDYLILGTIGATLILISIGFFLALTGNLNMSNIATILENQYSSRVVRTAITFFITGSILKMAFFPMHFWMIRSYTSVSPIILTYLASISGLMGVYTILRFIHFTIDGQIMHESFQYILRPAAMASIIICSIISLKSNTVKKIVIYSTSSQIGYIFLIMSIWSARALLFQLIILDVINKISMFTIIAHLQYKTDNLACASFQSIEHSRFFKVLVAAAVMFSTGLPMTSMFILKIKILDLLFVQNLYLEFIIVIIGSAFSLLYHLEFLKVIFFSSKKNGTIKIDTKLYGLTALIILQILTMIYMQEIDSLTQYAAAYIIMHK